MEIFDAKRTGTIGYRRKQIVMSAEPTLAIQNES